LGITTSVSGRHVIVQSPRLRHCQRRSPLSLGVGGLSLRNVTLAATYLSPAVSPMIGERIAQYAAGGAGQLPVIRIGYWLRLLSIVTPSYYQVVSTLHCPTISSTPSTTEPTRSHPAPTVNQPPVLLCVYVVVAGVWGVWWGCGGLPRSWCGLCVAWCGVVCVKRVVGWGSAGWEAVVAWWGV